MGNLSIRLKLKKIMCDLFFNGIVYEFQTNMSSMTVVCFLKKKQKFFTV